MRFHKNQNQELGEEQRAEHRKARRYASTAMVKINGFEGAALLKGINAGGLCMESLTYVSLNLHETYVLSIEPEPAFGIEGFELKVKVQCLHSSATLFSTDFSITEPPQGKAFQTYTEAVSRGQS